eukprot:CAMPEP_0184752154 /NCGR_PEP_ID=MMETSP0315-20130426/43431_1 /TAXON_ID=101924 /ORGANISM="Rhodosorus marinus, Strain UTEX LB 2760" /LENGTH=232 /DNA_ID=CAMNT_0027231471 /DNA_START=265 /DNA_END=964 /DNA_ORIENTATION=-
MPIVTNANSLRSGTTRLLKAYLQGMRLEEVRGDVQDTACLPGMRLEEVRGGLHPVKVLVDLQMFLNDIGSYATMTRKILISVLVCSFLIVQLSAFPSEHRRHHAHRHEREHVALRLNNSTTEGMPPKNETGRGPWRRPGGGMPPRNETGGGPWRRPGDGMPPRNETGGGPWRRPGDGMPPRNETDSGPRGPDGRRLPPPGVLRRQLCGEIISHSPTLCEIELVGTFCAAECS